MYIKVQTAVPYVYAAGSDGRTHAGFPKKNSGPAPEGFLYQRVLGPVTAIVESHNGLTIFIKGVRVTPGVSLHPFSTRRKDVAAHSMAFSVGSRFLCADRSESPLSAHAIKHRLCFGTPFLFDKNGGKEPSGGFPP